MANETTNVTGMEDFLQSGYYQTLGIDDLQSRLSDYSVDDADLRSQAEALYNPSYQAELEALQQSADKQTLAYQNQIAGAGQVYDRQRRLLAQQYDQSASQMNNALTKRGLGRSSLVATQGAYLEGQRGQALSDVSLQEASAIDAINAQIAQLASQTASTEQRLSGNYAQQIEARISELKNTNQSAATNLALQIATLQQQGYQAYQQQILAERQQKLAEDQFAWQKKKSGSSGSSSGSKSSGSPKPTNNNPPPASSDGWLTNLINSLKPTAGATVKNPKIGGAVVTKPATTTKPKTTVGGGSGGIMTKAVQ